MLFPKNVILFFALGILNAFAAENPGVVSSAIHAETSLSPEILTNEGIVALANAGFSNAFIVEKVLISNRTRFDTSVEGLSYLRRNAISEDLIEFILEHAALPISTPVPAAAAVMPAAPVVMTTKGKMKKISVPVGAMNVALAPGYAPAAPVVNVANPVVAPVAAPVVPAPAAVMVRPGYYSGYNTVVPAVTGRFLYAPVGYGAYSYAPYGYSYAPYGYSYAPYGYPGAAVVTVPQAPLAAASWWR